MPETTPGQPMEEILASIKRIIAEDAPLSFGPQVVPSNDAEPEDVLELDAPNPPSLTPPEPAQGPPGWSRTDGAAEHPTQPDPALVASEPVRYHRGEPIVPDPAPDYVSSAATLAPAEPQPVVAVAVPTPIGDAPNPEPAPMLDPATIGAAPGPEPAYEGLLSAGAEAASRQALAALATLTIDSRAAPNTLDGLVREMIRPMLKEWLDRNLPLLVEQLVAKEIKRLGRG